MPREHVFLPVTTKAMVSIPKIVCVPDIVSITEIVSVPEVGSGISLVPHACGGWISVIRESRETITLTRLSDGCCSVWTRSGKRCSISVNRRLAEPSRPVRTHSR
jgi:hypothetical protein